MGSLMNRALRAVCGLAAFGVSLPCVAAHGGSIAPDPKPEAQAQSASAPGPATPAGGQPEAAPPDFSRPTLYVVGYAHLDTQWRWSYLDTIREFIPETMSRNYALFEKYPRYVFNFSGSRRYEMMREYYPDEYAKLKGYIDSGRWFPCGSSVDEADANVPSGESQVRHVLYGNRFFRANLGVASDEFMLPDCFGFPASLPTVLAHCGVKGFSTQKLTWNAVVPIPFKVGVWEGPDGSSVVAALDPGAYVGEVREDLSKSDSWLQRINANGQKSGVFVDYHYFGTGDQGGAPKEPSVAMVEQSVINGAAAGAPIRVISSRADEMFKALSESQREKLPRYKGELELTQHSAGSVSSQAYMKRWNRKNELLADSAEKASVAAWWLGGPDYPADRLERAWGLVLGSQMHDILPGTSVPVAYDLSWNDEVIAANQFGAMLTDGARAVIAGMDTRGDGTPMVVFNPLGHARRDLVVADFPGAGKEPGRIVVEGPDGRPVPAQVLGGGAGGSRVAFVAAAPSVGFAVYTIRHDPSKPDPNETALRVTDDGRRLESERYIVKIDDRGDVASIYDRSLDKELLSAPARIGLFYENPSQWPAWNQDWSDRVKPATSFVGDDGPVTIRVVESGPARVAVEVRREAEGSTFTQRVALTAGGDRVEFDLTVDWTSRQRSARVQFPLTASNPIATFDIQAGAIERPNSHETQYEYPFHQWFDLTNADLSFGATVMCDSKYASDKPSDNTVRLTLLYTPGVRGGYPDQASQDLGRHRISYAIAGHAGDWRAARTFLSAAGFNQPLIPFLAPVHEGALGKSFSLLGVSDPNVSVQALKKAGDSDEVIVRLREHSGLDAKGVRVSFGRGITAAREVDGQERALGEATVRDGELVTDVRGYGLRAFALRLSRPESRIAPPTSRCIALKFDTDVMSTNARRGDGAMTSAAAYPAEQMPGSLRIGGVQFELGGGESDGEPNAVAARGQSVDLTGGSFNRLYVIAASSEGDVRAEFRLDGQIAPVTVPSWTGYVGQWDRREWPGDVFDPRYAWDSREPLGLTPGFVKPAEIAWFVSHFHTTEELTGVVSDGRRDAEGFDAIYRYCYLFKIPVWTIGQSGVLALPRTLTLPNDPRVKVLAIAAANEPDATTVAAAPLFDTLNDRTVEQPRIVVGDGTGPERRVWSDAVTVRIVPGLYGRQDEVRYTTDGGTPGEQSPAYSGPITLNKTTTVRAVATNPDGSLGWVVSRVVDVDDRTPPRLTAVRPGYQSSKLTLEFSEPVAAIDAASVRLDPPVTVESVEMDRLGRTATLRLSSPPKVGKSYTLTLAQFRDQSPNQNTTANVRQSFTVAGPVFAMDSIERSRFGTAIKDVPGLPTRAGDAWTINIFARMDKQPTNHTILAGFGNCGSEQGQGRYLCKFADGVHFWAHNQDVRGSEQYDLHRWQMVTATFDGATIRVYKDARLVGERPASLADDANVVQIAPIDPWDQRYQFKGDLAGLTVWNTALDAESLKALLDAGPK